MSTLLFPFFFFLTLLSLSINYYIFHFILLPIFLLTVFLSFLFSFSLSVSVFFSYFLTSHHVHYRLSHSLHLLLCSFSLVFSLHSSVHLVRVLGLFLFLSFALNPLSKKSSQIFWGKFADYSFFENHLKFCSISFFIPRYGDFSSFVF